LYIWNDRVIRLTLQCVFHVFYFLGFLKFVVGKKNNSFFYAYPRFRCVVTIWFR